MAAPPRASARSEPLVFASKVGSSETFASKSTICAVLLSASLVATPKRASTYMGVYPLSDLDTTASGSSWHRRRTTCTGVGKWRAVSCGQSIAT